MSRRADMTLLHPGFARQVYAVMDELAAVGIPLQVFETIRSPARQEELYRRGRDPEAADYGRRVTNAQPYESAHQYGLAVDMVLFIDGKWTWDLPRDKPGCWDLYHAIAKERGLVPLSFEKPHIQVKAFDHKLLDRGPADEAGWLEWLKARYTRMG